MRNAALGLKLRYMAKNIFKTIDELYGYSLNYFQRPKCIWDSYTVYLHKYIPEDS